MYWILHTMIMPGRTNETGMKIQCKHCGYTWLTQSDRAITSCPNCQWRVRLRPSVRNEMNPVATYSSPEQQAPKRYY